MGCSWAKGKAPNQASRQNVLVLRAAMGQAPAWQPGGKVLRLPEYLHNSHNKSVISNGIRCKSLKWIVPFPYLPVLQRTFSHER